MAENEGSEKGKQGVATPTTDKQVGENEKWALDKLPVTDSASKGVNLKDGKGGK